MSAHHKLTTVLQRANALICMDHINVNANLHLQEMGKHAMVGQEYTTACLLISFLFISAYQCVEDVILLFILFNFYFFIFLFYLFFFFFTDIDECTTEAHDCSSNGICTNVDGSFQCVCEPGFTGDGKTCSGRKRI